MIPSLDEIHNRLNTSMVQSVVLNSSDYFKLADEYVSLQKIFIRDTIFSTVSLWMDMVIVPIGLIFKSLFAKSFDVFSIFSFQKCLTLWRDWFRFKELGRMLREWVKLVRAIGGPFISANEAEYHVFVYADGMQRISNSLLRHLRVSEERTKRL
jgi:hypothetical protein